MDDQKVKAFVCAALQRPKGETRPLNFKERLERSIAHRLAVQMEKDFGVDWDVDCEYNRRGYLTKELRDITECGAQKKTDRIRPDIIVHRRRRRGRENNLLVVELKCDDAHDECDHIKLELLTNPNGEYAYQLGLYIHINGGDFICTWYKDGCEVPSA